MKGGWRELKGQAKRSDLLGGQQGNHESKTLETLMTNKVRADKHLSDLHGLLNSMADNHHPDVHGLLKTMASLYKK